MRKPSAADTAYNAALDAAAEWLRVHARRLRGQPVIGGVLVDQLADGLQKLRRAPRPDAGRG